MLADKHRVISGRSQHGGIIGPGDARLGHPHDTSGHLRGHAHGTGGVDGERDEIALVHPDEIGAGIDGPLQFRFIVDLNEGIKTDTTGEVQERHKFALIKCGCDEQHAIGSHEAGIAHIMSADREVLAQYRQRTGLSRSDEIGG